MASFKKLTDHELSVVHEWLRTMGMSVNRLLHREYADGYLVAKLLKQMYPQLVNLHAYQRTYTHNLKVVNWQTLNFKVFRRIGLPLSSGQIELLARGENGTIERLMWTLMNYSVDGKIFKSMPRKDLSIPKNETIKKPQRRITRTPRNLLKKSSSVSTNNTNGNGSVNGNVNVVTAVNKRNVDEQIKADPYLAAHSAFEEALKKASTRVSLLEEHLNQRNRQIEQLKSKIQAYETENLAFRKAATLIKRINANEIY